MFPVTGPNLSPVFVTLIIGQWKRVYSRVSKLLPVRTENRERERYIQEYNRKIKTQIDNKKRKITE